MIYIRREVKLALTAIAAVVILIWGINFLKAKALFDNNNVFYGIYDRVDGLKVSSSVIYRGYGVGQVNSIQFVGERYDKVLVQFTVGKDLQIPCNSVAAIQSADLMGSKAINIIPGDDLKYAESGDTLRSQLALGLMEQLNEQLEPLKKKAENMLVSLDTVLIALQEIFNDGSNGNIRGSLQSVSRTLDNVEEASSTLNALLSKESKRISQILEDVNSVTGNLKNNNDNIAKGMDNIVSISDSLRAVNLNHTIRSLNSVLAQADSIMKAVNRGQGTLGGMVYDDALYTSMTQLSENLNRLLVEFRQNPKRFINLSMFSMGAGKPLEIHHYGIVIAESAKPLPLNDDLYIKYPDLKQIRRNGAYLYLIRTYNELKDAEKDLENVGKIFKDAYIVKVD